MDDMKKGIMPAKMTEVKKVYEHTSARMNAHAMEALQELFHRIPFGSKITLANGKTATIEPFVEPCVDHDGKLCALIDVKYDDGSGHFEFCLYQSGWGGVP